MALVTCPDCTRELSSTAETCPDCGFDMAKHPIRVEEDRQLEDARESLGDAKFGWWIGLILALGTGLQMDHSIIRVLVGLGGLFCIVKLAEVDDKFRKLAHKGDTSRLEP